MSVPQDRRYLQTHEWHKQDGQIVTIGITQIAADELTDITYVKLPKIGDAIKAGAAFGEIESVKATSDLYSGVSGSVTAVNKELDEQPGLVNSDPYDKGWMIKVKVSPQESGSGLLPSDEYLKLTGH